MKLKLSIIKYCSLLFVISSCNTDKISLIEVSPNANEEIVVGTGKPVSLTTAKAYIQQLNKIDKLPDGGITVELGGGVYSITETLIFSSEDGGNETNPVSYKAKKGETPVFSGGKVITGWEDQGNNIWKVTLPEVAEGKLFFRQLFADNKRLTRARTPNEGWFRILGQTVDYDTLPKWKLENLQDIKPNDPKIVCGAKFDLNKLPIGEPDMKQAELLILSSWSASWTSIQSINEENGDVLFNTPLDWPANVFPEPNPYRIENVRSALDEAGEWYVNSETGELLLQVAEEENPNEWEIVAPTLEMLVRVEGTKEKPVSNLTFEGIHFKHAKVKMGVYEYSVHEKRLTDKVDELLWDWPADIQQFYPEWPNKDEFMPGYSDLQAAVRAGAAFEISKANNIKVTNAKFSHLGAHGIYIRLHASDTEVSNSEFFNLGGGGIYQGYITSEYLMAGLSNEDVPTRSVIKNNLIHQGTKFHVGAVGIFLSQTHNNQVIHNEIKEMGYSGISMGWTWGIEPTLVYKNVIAYNHIHHVVQDMADGGGIYTLGTMTACEIKENYIHDIFRSETADGVHIKALYFDQGSQGPIIKRNVMHDIGDSYMSYHARQIPLTSFRFEENYFADSVTRSWDYINFHTYHVPDSKYAKPGDAEFPTELVDRIVKEAGLQTK